MLVGLLLCLLLVGGVVAPTAAIALGVYPVGYTHDLEPHAARVATTSYDAASALVVPATVIREAALGVARAPSADLRQALKPTGFSYDHPRPLVSSLRATTGGRAPPGLVANEGSGGRSARNSATGLASKALPSALTVGKNAETGVHVYAGVSAGKSVYAGITNNIGRRQLQHGTRFLVQQMTRSGVTRGEARAIEEALIARAGGTVREGGTYQNINHSISPNQSYYQQAVDWGEAWLGRIGY